MAKKTIPIKVRQEVDRYIQILKEDKLPIQKAILFGSYSKGKQHKWSDIDLCIISPKFKGAFNATQYLWTKRKIFDVKYAIEPIGFNPKDFKHDSALTSEIKRTGIEVAVK